MQGHVWLVGMMGSGKTTVGEALGALMGRPFVDTDDLIASSGRSIEQIFTEDGEEAFRAMEKEAVADVALLPAAVVATGGGVVLDEGNVRRMRGSGGVVWLIASLATLQARTGDGRGRPLLAESAADNLVALLENREASYRAAAHLDVVTDNRMPDEVAQEIEAWWNA